MSTRYLTVREVVQLHDAECGQTAVDSALLESAVGRPQASAFGEDAYHTLHAKVGALFHSLCENQAFGDGNKRVAVVAAYAMYALNGFVLTKETTVVVDLAFGAAEHGFDAQKIGEELERMAVPIAELMPPDLGDFDS